MQKNKIIKGDVTVEINTNCKDCEYSYVDGSYFCGLFKSEFLSKLSLVSDTIIRCDECIKTFGE